MTVGSLFSGIGGFDLGLERSGHVIQWQVESNAYCRSVLRRHWPHVKRYEDAVTVDTCSLARVDCICAGWPCQPVSVAGLRKGVDDVDWLWPSVVRVVSDLRPRVVLLENTAGLFTANDGRAFGQVLGDLAEIRYDCEWAVLSARTLGAPHRRERVFIVGIMADTNSERSQRYGKEYKLREDSQKIKASRSSTSKRDETDVADTESSIGYDDEAVARNGEFKTQEVFGDRSSIRGESAWWDVEPNVGRVAHGIPGRVHRLKGLGNSIVPQIAEEIGRAIIKAMK